LKRLHRGWRGVLSLACAFATGCDDPDGGGSALDVGEAIHGELRGDNRAMPSMQWAAAIDAGAELDASYAGYFNADTYTLDLDAGESVQVVMCATGDNNVLDPYLIVDFNGQRVVTDDDSAGDVNARVQIDAAESGRYTVYATVVTQVAAYDGNRSYMLRVAETDTDGGPPLGCE
jgi:hypothetical protein